MTLFSALSNEETFLRIDAMFTGVGNVFANAVFFLLLWRLLVMFKVLSISLIPPCVGR